MDLRARLRPERGAAVVSSGECARGARAAHHRGAARADCQSGVRLGRPELANAPAVRGVHVREPDDAGTRALAIRPLRDAGAHRRARRTMAGLLDGWRAGDLAGERRDRRNGVLPRTGLATRWLGG